MEIRKAELEVLKHLNQKHSNRYRSESTDHAQEVHHSHLAPLPEKDGCGQQNQQREHHKVDDTKDTGVKALEGLVDVNELDEDAARQHGE